MHLHDEHEHMDDITHTHTHTHNNIHRYVWIIILDEAAMEALVSFAYTSSMSINEKNMQHLLKVAAILQLMDQLQILVIAHRLTPPKSPQKATPPQ